jgi:uncharacterized protein (DUF2252 family)
VKSERENRLFQYLSSYLWQNYPTVATIAERIKAFNAGRLEEMLPAKYELMSENMFRFFRGTCHLFYEDLAAGNDLPHTPLTWICGDLHLENFGTYKGDNRLVYFDLNDFDEALKAPAAYELARMICSIFIAFDSLKIEDKQALNMAGLFLKNYSAHLVKGKALYIDPLTSRGIVRDFLVAVSKRKQKAILEKRTIRKKHNLALLMAHPRHYALEKPLKKELMQHVNEWIRSGHESPNNYEAVDVAFRLAGTGSIGLKRYMFLLRSVNQVEKYMLVEMKQAISSSVKPYVQAMQPEWTTEAHRIVAIQERMQNISPALLSHSVFRNDAYLMQEMQPTKDSFNFKTIRDQYRDIYQVISDMALLTASSHLRSSGWRGAANVDELEAFGKDDQWQEQIVRYALRYSKKVATEYDEYEKAYKGGEFPA